MRFLDNAKKKAAETAELARHKAEEAAALAREKAEEAAELARLKAEEIRLSELCAAVSEKTGKVWNSMAESVVGAKDSTIEFIHRKICDTVRGMNLHETIAAIEKAGKEQHINVVPLVKFVERIKQIGDDHER